MPLHAHHDFISLRTVPSTRAEHKLTRRDPAMQREYEKSLKRQGVKVYKLKKTRPFLGPQQQTVPRVSLLKSSVNKSAPGPATYSNSVPNAFGRQFRVGSGRSAVAVRFGTAQRFEKGKHMFAGAVNTVQKECSPYIRSAQIGAKRPRKRRPKSAGQSKVMSKSGEKNIPLSRSLKMITRSGSSTQLPGPMCYVQSDAAIGKQVVSARKTSPAVGFGKAKRRINLSSLVANSDHPKDSPGPVDYNTLRSCVKLSRHQPTCHFGTSPRWTYF